MALQRDLDLDVDPELVWELITRPEDLAAWLGEQVDLEPSPGTRGHVVDEDGTVRHLVVGEVDLGRRLSWDWWEEGDGTVSRVELTLDPTEHGTRLRVREVPHPVSPGLAPRATASLRRRWNRQLVDLELLAMLRSPLLHRV
jgi:uncharacterized protein YndB with AHSA1/START domain